MLGMSMKIAIFDIICDSYEAVRTLRTASEYFSNNSQFQQ